MKNRIPPYYDEINLERPSICHPNLVLTVSEMGFLDLNWITPGEIFYRETYHIETNARVSWAFSHEPLDN